MNHQTVNGQHIKNKQITDADLKRTLAKMLPEFIDIEIEHIYPFSERFRNLVWKQREDWPEVLDTELLHLCWLAEETLDAPYKIRYMQTLYNLPEFDHPIYLDELDWSVVYCYTHATWQQRTIALAKTKSIEICQ